MDDRPMALRSNGAMKQEPDAARLRNPPALAVGRMSNKNRGLTGPMTGKFGRQRKNLHPAAAAYMLDPNGNAKGFG